MGFYRASFGGGGQYTQADIDSYYIEADGVKYLPDFGLFERNSIFNSPINIGDNVTITDYLCAYSTNFNSEVRFGNNVESTGQAFTSCYIFNQPVTIPSTVKNARMMFANCFQFNQPITLERAIECAYMFDGCANFNQQFVVPATAMNVWGMFRNCVNLHNNIYVKGNEYRRLNAKNMIIGVSNSHRINIFFNSALNNVFNRSSTDSITGRAISWTSMENGFYNYSYNIYCYYNYEG